MQRCWICRYPYRGSGTVGWARPTEVGTVCSIPGHTEASENITCNMFSHWEEFTSGAATESTMSHRGSCDRRKKATKLTTRDSPTGVQKASLTKLNWFIKEGDSSKRLVGSMALMYKLQVMKRGSSQWKGVHNFKYLIKSTWSWSATPIRSSEGWCGLKSNFHQIKQTKHRWKSAIWIGFDWKRHLFNAWRELYVITSKPNMTNLILKHPQGRWDISELFH